MSREFEKVLLLTGPQHWDERRPLSASIRRGFEQMDSLGIAIVSTVLKKHGIETTLQTMEPSKMNQLETYIENAGAVFISSRHFDTSLSQQAIEMANKHKKPVVVGGYGPTFNHQAFEKATTRVIGEAEPILDQLADDLLTGTLKPLYNATLLPPYDLKNYIRPDRGIFPTWPNNLKHLKRHAQEWQRGCINRCSFCSPARLQGKGVRVRETADIIAEIEQMKLKRDDYLFSVDLNATAAPRENLYELFQYLQEKGIRWFTEGTVKPLLENPELLRLMSAKDGKGGCYGFLYGADDLARETVSGSDKERRLLFEMADVFRKLAIPLNLSVVVGLDHHQFPETFFQIASILEEVGAPYVFLHIATPYQETPWGKQVYQEGRVFEKESTHFNHRQVVAHPKNMTAEQLQQGYYWLMKRLNSPQMMAKVARKNVADASILVKNPTLGVMLSGLPWGLETYLGTLELSAREYMNPKIQKMLDHEYRKSTRKGTLLECTEDRKLTLLKN